MFKRRMYIVFAVSISLVLIGILLYLIPWVTPVDLTLDAIKLDSDGNEIGTEQLQIKGYRYDYLFQKDRMDVTIKPLGIRSIDVQTNNSVTGTGVIHSCGAIFDPECSRVSLGGWNSDAGYMLVSDLYFTEEFDRFGLVCRPYGDDVFSYVMSINGNYKSQELLEYFKGLVPGYQPA